MATKKYWIGSTGPFYHDDVTFPEAFKSDQPIAPGQGTDPSHAALLEDIPAVLITGAERGDILYYNGTSWVARKHGTLGQVLMTQGHGQDPVWVTLGTTYWDFLVPTYWPINYWPDSYWP